MVAQYVVSCDCGWTRAYSARGRADLWASRHRCPDAPRAHRRRCTSCGWSGIFKTAGIANRSKASHSCEHQLLLKGQRLRGELRRLLVDHTPKPCLHKVAEHQHGTHACYVLDRCKCPACSVANATYESERSRQHAYGRWDNYVDAEPARQHVRALMAQGMGLKRIVTTGAISQGGLWKLIYGKRRPDGTQTPSRRITKRIAEQILAVELDLADGAVVSAHGTVLRIRALVTLGWSQSKLAARLGIQPSNFRLAGTMHTTANRAAAVRALYAELSMTLPPEDRHHDRSAASRARKYAADRGWLPPLALDDDRLDDPGYEPWFEHGIDVHDDDQAVAS